MTQPGTPTTPSPDPDPNIPAAKGTDKVLVDLDEAAFRMQLLTLAHNNVDTPDQVIARVKKYYRWFNKIDDNAS
jgi:hypothetical protein